MTTKIAPTWPCNELGEIVATTGNGSTTVTGFLGESQIPIDDATGKVAMAGMQATIIQSASAPNNADGRPDGTIYIQTV